MEMASLVITSEKKNAKKSATMDHVLNDRRGTPSSIEFYNLY